MSYKTVGLLICGIGDDPAKSKGIVWCYGTAPSSSVTDDYEWLPIATDAPESVATTVNWWSGELETSAIDISVACPDPYVARYLMSVANKPVAGLQAGISSSSTTIDLGKSGLEATVIWVDEEAILLGLESSGSYSDCVRGYYSTWPSPHVAGAAVYDRPQYLQVRETQLLVYDWGADSLTVVQRGYVDDVIADDDGTGIKIRTYELTTLLAGATINRAPRTIPVSGTVIDVGSLGQMLQLDTDFESNVLMQDGQVFLQVDDAIVPASYDESSGRITTLLPPKAIWRGAPDVADELGPFTGDASELFVVLRSYFADPRTASSTVGLPINAYNHPIGVVYGLCRAGSDGGTWDQWHPSWGLGLREEWFDHSAIEAEIAQTQDAKMDSLILGWDEESPTISDIWQYTGHPYGFILAPTQEGLISFRKIRTLDIESWGNAPLINIIPPQLKQQPQLSGQFSSAIALVGEKPWDNAQKINVTSDSVNPNPALFERKRELTYDYRSINKGDPENPAITPTLLGRVLQGVQSINEVTVDCLAVPGKPFDLGSWVRLQAIDPITNFSGIDTDAWVDPVTGELIAIDGSDPRFAGIIVGRHYEIETGIYRLTLLMQGSRNQGFARLRAPSGIVGSYTSMTNTITLAPEFSGVDDEYFLPDDRIDLCAQDGTVLESNVPILTVSGTSLGFGSYTWGTTPSPDRIIRLSNFTDYGTGGEPIGVGVRGYVFIASISTGTIDGSEPADIYG